MKEIPLTKGKFSVVSDEDFVRVSAYRWYYSSGYASNSRMGALHRFILSAVKGQNVDHINGDRLDNRRENLRFATHTQNMQNKHVAWGKSKYKGVIWSKTLNAWLVRIRANGERIYVGQFRDEIEAAKAYNAAALEMHADYAALNVIDGYTNGKEAAQQPKRFKPRKAGTSAYRGVSRDERRGGFIAQVSLGTEKRMKRFTDEVAAAVWYNIEAEKMFGDDALLNVIPEEFQHYRAMILADELAFTPKQDKPSKHQNVFRARDAWMVRIKKGGKTVFQKNFATEEEAAKVAAEMRLTL